jgi:hypothetical protein
MHALLIYFIYHDDLKRQYMAELDVLQDVPPGRSSSQSVNQKTEAYG